MIRWGILGSAKIAEEQLIPALHQASGAELVAVASRDTIRATEYAARNNIRDVYESYEALLAAPNIDAVYIPLPNHLHAKWSIAAAKQGKHILCEKPAALNEREIREVIETCEAHSVVWMEAFMYQFHPQWERVHDILSSGEIGEIKLVAASFSFPLNRAEDIRWSGEMGGGALYDVGCYAVHVCRTLAKGAQLDTVKAVAKLTPDGQVDSTTSAVMKFANGLQAHIDCSFEVASRQHVEIVGTDGSVFVHYAFRPDQAEARLTIRAKSGTRTEALPAINMYTLQIEHFSRCIEEGSEPRNTHYDTIQNMNILDRIRAELKG